MWGLILLLKSEYLRLLMRMDSLEIVTENPRLLMWIDSLETVSERQKL